MTITTRVIRRLLPLALLALVACQPAAPTPAAQALPTVAVLPSPTPPSFSQDAAERAARMFLEAWKAGDFAAMHALTSFASQEATPLEAFTAAYTEAHSVMSLLGLDYTIASQLRDANNMEVFSYSVTFTTDLIGSFTDSNRTLRLVFDTRSQDWRVAWSPGDIFAAMGSGGRLRLEPRIPSRANIYDRDGLTLADQNGRMVVVSVVKRDIPQYDECVAVLAEALVRPAADVRGILDQRGFEQLSEMGLVEPAVFLRLQDRLQSACAAQYRDRAVRRYPDGTLAPHILGTVGFPSEAEVPAVVAAGFPRDSILGRSGIEQSWDATLRGKPGGRLLVVSPGGEQTVLAESASEPSQSVWLTLDTSLQTFVTSRIVRAYDEVLGPASRGAAAVVLDLNTGAILAMVSYPTFDNNAFNSFPVIGRAAADTLVRQVEADPRRPQLNRATLGAYPVGSVFKVVDAVAVLDSGVYTLDTRYTCVGGWNRDIRRVDWLAGGHGTQTVPQGLMNSCNPFFYEVGYQLDQADPWLLPTYARKLGLGAPTGLRDLPEVPGNIPDPDWLRQRGFNWTFSDSVNMAVGQGYVDVTPLQIVQVLAIVGNGGTRYRPQLVLQTGILGEAPSYTMQPEVLDTIEIDPVALAGVREGLCAVTTASSGTAEYVFRRSPLQRLVVCGKTGTAQAPGTGAAPHAWFAAYAPRDKPEVAVVVMVENAGEGSAIAAPIARDILEFYFFGEDAPDY